MEKLELLVISGTNRPGSNTFKVAKIIENLLATSNTSVKLLDLTNLKIDLFDTSSYQTKPIWFQDEFQKPILSAQGAIIVTPEYNGSYPGVLKYFIDMLKFPESLVGLPVGFVGCAAGQFGALRSVEQLEMLFHYRCAHIFGDRVFIPGVHNELTEQGLSSKYQELLNKMCTKFIDFCSNLKQS